MSQILLRTGEILTRHWQFLSQCQVGVV